MSVGDVMASVKLSALMFTFATRDALRLGLWACGGDSGELEFVSPICCTGVGIDAFGIVVDPVDVVSGR